MKIYKTFFFILLLVLIPFFTVVLFLYRQNRLVILYKKNNITSSNELLTYQEKLFGTVITDKEEKKIPFSITFNTFDKNAPEDFLYAILYQFFHYINLENIGKMNYELNHVGYNNKNIIIINGSLHQKKILTPYEEFLFLKSIFITISTIFPAIETIYFYDDEVPLKLNYHLPFFIKEMVISNHNIAKEYSDNKLATFYKVVLIPFFEGNGNIINGIFEKNLFVNSNLKSNLFR